MLTYLPPFYLNFDHNRPVSNVDKEENEGEKDTDAGEEGHHDDYGHLDVFPGHFDDRRVSRHLIKFHPIKI